MVDFSNAYGYISKMSSESVLALSGLMAYPAIQLYADCNLCAAEVWYDIVYEVAGNGIYYPTGGVFTFATLVPVHT